jgi:DNA-directed RNA polymerase I subunit RPA2
MEKFYFLVFAMQKLYCGVQDVSCPESPDHVMTQEVLLGGHLYLQIIKDKLLNWLTAIKYSVLKKCRKKPTFSMQPSKFIILTVNKIRHFN